MNKLTKEKFNIKGKCSFCNKNTKVESFGAYYICKDCLRWLKRTKRKPKGRIDLKICVCEPRDFDGKGGRSWYNSRTNTIMLSKKGFCLYSIEFETILTISHESIHFALMKAIGLEECHKFDAIAYKYASDFSIGWGYIDE